MYPMLISSLELQEGIVTVVVRTVIYKVHDESGAVETSLQGILTTSVVPMSTVVVVLSWM